MTYELPPIGHALSGGVAAALANVVIYPLDMATTRVQSQSTKDSSTSSFATSSLTPAPKKRVHYTSVPDAIRKIYASEGFAALYSGLGSDTIATLTSNFVYFYVYMALRQRKEHRRSSGQLSTFQELFLGAEAGIISRFFTAPIHVVTTRQQVMGKDLLQQQGNSGTTAGNTPKVSARSIIREIYAQDGITGFWAGYAPTVILSINPSITYFLFETIKKTILARQLKAAHSGSSSPSKSVLAAAASLTSLQIFFISACSKAIASFLTYPLILTKTKLQTKVQENDSTTNNNNVGGDLEKQQEENQPKSFNGISDVFKTVIKDKGIAGLYTGCQGQVVKGFFSFGLMYMIKDRVVAWMLTVFLAIHNMRNRVTSS
ncbi:mitochondrial carrier domain-containing protein [Linnemannia elongata]|nr:mitochondrial carrier domain-containing protein [Linnemannia elongata]